MLCNPWSTRLCPYPSLISKMKTYLELKGKPGPKPKPQLQPCISTFSHNSSLTRKTLMPKNAGKKRRARTLVKRRYKIRVITQPLATTPTSPMNPIPPAVPTPTGATSTATTQMPMVKSAAMSILVTVYNLAQGKCEGIPYPTGRPPAAVHPNKGNNLKLCPMPQPSRSERTPHSVTPYQPP